MKIDRIELRNFCQHRHFECELSDGLVALVGPNGSGKSNVLGAVIWLLTGEHPNAGTKADNIAQLAAENEPAYGSLRFSHNNVTATVTRHLRPTSQQSTLHLSTGGVVRGDRSVTEAILRFIGVETPQLLTDVCLVSQGDIFGFLAKTAAKRVEAFAKLFRTDVAEKIYNAINRRLSTLDLQDRTEAITESERQLEASEQQLARLQQFVAEDTVQSLHATISHYNQQLHSWRDYSNKQRRIQEITAQLPVAQQHVEAWQRLVEENTARIRLLETEMADQAASLAHASISLQHRQQQQKFAQSRRDVEANLALVRHSLQCTPRPTPPRADYTPELRAQLAASMTGVQQELTEDRRLLQSLTADGVAECPTCRTPVSTLAPVIQQKQHQLPGKQQRLQQLEHEYQQLCLYETNLRNFDYQVAAYQRDIANLEEYLSGLPAVAEPEDLTTLQAVVDRHTDYTSRLMLARDALSQNTERCNTARANLQALQSMLQQLQTELQQCTVSEAEATQAQTRLPVLESRLTDVAEALAVISSLHTQITQQRERLQQLRELQQQYLTRQSKVDKLITLRDVLHRDAAPRCVIQRNLARLQHDVNHQLEVLGTDYRVVATNGWSFLARFTDGRDQPAERLSGGQKVLLALAFRLAVSLGFTDLGFLILDEPTAYLDQAHIKHGFTQAMERLRHYVSDRGLQCMIITHEQSLAPLFDRVIQL